MKESRKLEIKSLIDEKAGTEELPKLVHLGHSWTKAAQNLTFWFLVNGKLVLMRLHKQTIRRVKNQCFIEFESIKIIMYKDKRMARQDLLLIVPRNIVGAKKRII